MLAKRVLAVLAPAFVVGLLSGCANQPRVETTLYRCDFDRTPVGQLPADWQLGQTRPTRALATWQVLRDETAPSGGQVLALTHTENYDGTFNLAIAKDTSFADLDLTVQVKAVAGAEDQGGGPLWRCQDENNYYICRLNPLESNFRVYVVADGKRRQLASQKIELAADRWYTVAVTMVGDAITCQLDGEPPLEARDATIRSAGCVGLWTKADAVTSFDDLTASTHPTPPANTK